MPKQWKYITLYMLLAYLAFVAAINIAKHEVLEDEKAQQQQVAHP